LKQQAAGGERQAARDDYMSKHDVPHFNHVYEAGQKCARLLVL
jgi:hypothetical protein